MSARSSGQALFRLAMSFSFWLSLSLSLFTASATQAGSFSVSPIRATLSTTSSVDSLTVRNNSDEPAIIQVEIDSWTQQDGQEVIAPSREILATPPIFTIPPKGTQVIRVGLRRAVDSERELTYRIFLQEVTPPRVGFQGLHVALRLSIPIFVLPPREAKPLLMWKATPTESGQIKLQATNTGNAHIQVLNFKLSRKGGEELNSQQAAAYILSHQSREWLVSAAAVPGARLQVIAQTDADEVQSEIMVSSP